jgi:hypothetical protein
MLLQLSSLWGATLNKSSEMMAFSFSINALEQLYLFKLLYCKIRTMLKFAHTILYVEDVIKAIHFLKKHLCFL